MFNLGDVVRGKPKNGYVYTTDLAVMEVVRIGEYEMNVRILMSSDYPDKVFTEYWVRMDCFVLVSDFNATVKGL